MAYYDNNGQCIDVRDKVRILEHEDERLIDQIGLVIYVGFVCIEVEVNGVGYTFEGHQVIIV